MAAELGELLVKLSADIKELETGLNQARTDLSGFQNFAQAFGANIKRALSFAGIAVGVYELLSSFKQFASASIEVGRSVEVMRLATYGLAEGLGMSMGVVDYWVEKMRSMGLSAEASWKTVQTALKTGIDLRQLDPLIKAIKNIAPLAGMSVNEAIDSVMRSIATGMPLALRNLEMPMAMVRKLMQETGQDAEGITKRFQTIADFIISYGQQMEGVAAKVGSSFAKQATQLANSTQRAKEALFDNFLKPLLTAVTGEKIKAWSELANWIAQNGEKLRELGTGLGIIIARLMQVVLFIGKIIASNPEWAKWVVMAWGATKAFAMLIGPIVSIGKSFRDAAAQGGVLGTVVTKLRAMLLALVANPYVISIVLAVSVIKTLKTLYEKAPEAVPHAMVGEAWGVMREEQQKQLNELGDFYKKAQQEKEKAEKAKEVTPERIAQETEAATKKALERLSNLTKDIGGGGGKGGKQQTEDLLSYLSQYMEAKRQLEIKDADESYQTFKATLEKKKAELDLALAEGKITGKEYMDSLREMAEAEVAEHLKLIQVKIEKEKESYEWAKKEVEERVAAGEVSPEAAELLLKKLNIEHTIRLKDLEGEAQRERIGLEQKYVELLKQEHEKRQQIEDILASMAQQAALGPIAEKEAGINRLLYEQEKERRRLKELGAADIQIAEFDRLAKQIEINKRVGDMAKGYAEMITGFFGDLIDAILDGEKDLTKTLQKFFKSLFKMGLEPVMKQLTQWLTNVFQQLFGALGEAVMGAIMMVIGLIGLLLTSGGSASWTPASIEKGVTHHEAVRGIIAGEESIPVAKVSESLRDALAPTNTILRQIEQNTRNLGANLSLSISIPGLQEAVSEAIERYFREYLMMGAMA
jgi:hypothetical protein